VFGRKRMSPADAIVEFWVWWSTARPRIEAAIESGTWDGLVDEMGTRVAAIHPKLQWEFAKGARARHCLVVCAAGNPTLRAVAARWLAPAPPTTDTWEYASARQPDLRAFTSTLKIDGHELALDQIRFAARPDPDRHEIDVACHHPGFAGLPDEARGQITFLALDWVLGEYAVELWVGEVTWVVEPPPAAEPPAALAAAVAALAAEHHEPVWALLRGETRSGAPVLATVQQPLKSVRWPRFDTHVAVVLPYRLVNDVGLPFEDSLEALREFEDRLTAAVGRDGELVAHETAEGRRTLHFYADPATDAVSTIEGAGSGWPEGRASVKRAYDPGFERVRHLRP
jgi:hypothetical protein